MERASDKENNLLYDDEEQNTQLIRLLGEALIQRRDVKARQSDDGQWMPVRKDPNNPDLGFAPLTLMDFKMHLGGQHTLGHYLLDTKNLCKFFAFDLDVVEAKPDADPPVTYTFNDPEQGIEGLELDPRAVWMNQDESHPAFRTIRAQLRTLAETIAMQVNEIFGNDVRVVVVDSGGKGLHVYGLTGPEPAEVQRQLAEGVLKKLGPFTPTKGNNFFRYGPDDEFPEAYKFVEIEVFPKQDKLQEGGLGNLLALPLGVNRRTGRQRQFVTFTTKPFMEGWSYLDPIEALEGARVWG